MMNFQNLSVVRKLWGLVLGLMLVMLVLLATMVTHVQKLGSESQRIALANEERLGLALRWQGLTALAVERAVLGVSLADEAVAERLRGQAQHNIQTINGLQKQIEDKAFSAEDKAQLARVIEARKVVLEGIGQAGRMRAENDFAGVLTLVEQQLNPAVERYVAQQDAFAQLQQRQRDETVQLMAAQQLRAEWLGGAIALAVALAGILLSALLVRSITRPLARAVALADAIAAGDLTQDAPDARRDELGQLLRALSAMAQRLRGVVGQVRAGVESVSSASSQIASGNQDLSARTEQTAANLQQTAASMEQLTATVGQSAETARQANQLAVRAAQAAEQGGHMVGQVVASMQRITTSSRQIADIIQVIDSIAFQTNILALNAAVEAARAGEQGRGFAVVAGEVRSLAQRSAEAAKEIKQLIGASVDSVQAGSAQVEQAGQGMHGIVEGVRRVGELIAEITASSAEQANGIGQVNQAVAQLDQMTQQNAALVEQSSAAAAAMHEQAQRLAQVVAVFRVGQEAPATGARPLPRAAAAMPAPRLADGAGKPRMPAPAAIKKAAAPAPAAPRIAAPPRAELAMAGAQDDWESF